MSHTHALSRMAMRWEMTNCPVYNASPRLKCNEVQRNAEFGRITHPSNGTMNTLQTPELCDVLFCHCPMTAGGRLAKLLLAVLNPSTPSPGAGSRGRG
eukprot:2132104-Rhodomonas_salina.1